ncbi:MAG: hypothetical protein HYZ26_14445 [Chloroflexi bacterium]|nr:hypothetical protein [Chloroflexota bacterium]
MLIDEFLPDYQFVERHTILIPRPPADIYPAVRALDLSASPVVRALFRLRGLPPAALRLEGLLKMGFTLLAEEPPEEILLGLAGQFWALKGNLLPLDPAAFRQFDRPDYARAAWNFTLAADGLSATRLATETRIHCPTPQTRRRFAAYWAFIGPFSAWIRREALRAVKRRVESVTPPSTRTPAA